MGIKFKVGLNLDADHLFVVVVVVVVVVVPLEQHTSFRSPKLPISCISSSFAEPQKYITMSPPSSSNGKDSGAARVLGSGASGQYPHIHTLHSDTDNNPQVLRNSSFFTLLTRWQSAWWVTKPRSVLSYFHLHELINQPQVSFSTLSPIIFRDASSAPIARKFLSLFPGLGYAAGYKVAQRVYKFGGQPWFNDLINKHYKSNFTNTFGERKGKMMMQATAGR